MDKYQVKPVLDNKVFNAILLCVWNGNTIREACTHLNISSSVLYRDMNDRQRNWLISTKKIYNKVKKVDDNHDEGNIIIGYTDDIVDKISDNNVDTFVTSMDFSVDLCRMLSVLPNVKIRNLIIDYFGLFNNKALSLDQLGEKHDLTRARVSQIIYHYVSKIRKNINGLNIKYYFNYDIDEGNSTDGFSWHRIKPRIDNKLPVYIKNCEKEIAEINTFLLNNKLGISKQIIRKKNRLITLQKKLDKYYSLYPNHYVNPQPCQEVRTWGKACAFDIYFGKRSH